jgi:dihydrofolate reductase
MIFGFTTNLKKGGLVGKVKVSGFSVSLDGFGAGPNQSMENPIGINGHSLHGWLFQTKMFHQMTGKPGGESGVDNAFAMEMLENAGACIMGRNMFSPLRGPWPNHEWKGWWGPNPPYHAPVFVLTHFARPSIEMEGGTTFHFVTEGIEAALKKAKEVAGNKDVKICGGASVIRQYLKSKLIDELQLTYSPTFLGQGELLLEGIDVCKLGYKLIEQKTTEKATHIRLSR